MKAVCTQSSREGHGGAPKGMVYDRWHNFSLPPEVVGSGLGNREKNLKPIQHT